MLAGRAWCILPLQKQNNKRRGKVGVSRGRKIKALGRGDEENVFWMSLDEAKRMIADKYEFLAEQYERRQPKNKQV